MGIRSKRRKELFKALRESRDYITKMTIENESLREANTVLGQQLEKTLDKLEVMTDKFTKAATKIDKMETFARANVSKNLDLQFMEVRGNFPVLWINSPDPSVVNHGTFAQIKDKLHRMCPRIEMILLTYGNVKLWELDNNDLAKVGLCRIDGHTGGALTEKPAALLPPGESDSE